MYSVCLDRSLATVNDKRVSFLVVCFNYISLYFNSMDLFFQFDTRPRVEPSRRQ